MWLIILVVGVLAIAWLLAAAKSRSAQATVPRLLPRDTPPRPSSAGAPLAQDQATSALSQLGITVTVTHVDDHRPEAPKPQEIAPRVWRFNTDTALPLTLRALDASTAASIHEILSGSVSHWDATQKILPLIARHNVECVEIEDYVRKYRPAYLLAVEQMKQQSSEWRSSSELDKEDMLLEFRRAAVSALRIIVHAGRSYDESSNDCSIALFDQEPHDLTIDDALIDRFGFDNVQFYLRVYDPVAVCQPCHERDLDNPERKQFENLVKVGLAVRGLEIPPQSIIAGLRLKDMNELAAGLVAKPFGRKARAVEFLLQVPDLKQRIANKLPLRSLFCPMPLPVEFAGLELQKLAESIKYAHLISSVVAQTFEAARRFKDTVSSDSEFVSGWSIQADQTACKTCRAMASKKYTRRNPPNLPTHVGCRCWLRTEYNDKGA